MVCSFPAIGGTTMKYRRRSIKKCYKCGNEYKYNNLGDHYSEYCPDCLNNPSGNNTGALVAVEVATESIVSGIIESKLEQSEICRIALLAVNDLTKQGYLRSRGYGELTQEEIEIINKSNTNSGFGINLKENPELAIVVLSLVEWGLIEPFRGGRTRFEVYGVTEKGKLALGIYNKLQSGIYYQRN